jgi:hypothetical protein
MAPLSQHLPGVTHEARKEDVQLGTTPRGTHTQAKPDSFSGDSVASASGSGSSSHDHATASGSMFRIDGSWRVMPSQQYIDHQAHQDSFHICGDASGNPTTITEDRPPTNASPPRGQPRHVEKPLVPSQSEFQHRVASLKCTDLAKVIQFYGGSSPESRLLVLEYVEQCRRNGRNPIQVVRKDGQKRGVDRVLCGECDQTFISVQKAAEHITSFHWRLSIWSCYKKDWCVYRGVVYPPR